MQLFYDVYRTAFAPTDYCATTCIPGRPHGDSRQISGPTPGLYHCGHVTVENVLGIRKIKLLHPPFALHPEQIQSTPRDWNASVSPRLRRPRCAPVCAFHSQASPASNHKQSDDEARLPHWTTPETQDRTMIVAREVWLCSHWSLVGCLIKRPAPRLEPCIHPYCRP